MPRILFVTPGCFDKGGISRYSRYQINALREMYGDDNIKVLSLLSADSKGFEEDFQVDWSGPGPTLFGKIRLVTKIAYQLLFWKPHVLHLAHMNFAGLGVLMTLFSKIQVVVNTYGLEVWSNPSRDALWGLKRANWVLSDCKFTASYIESNGLRPKESIYVIWDCVDLEKFSVDASNTNLSKYGVNCPSDSFIILTLGRIAKGAMHKGYDRLINVFSKFSSKYPEARLVIAGRGDAVVQLKQQTEAIGLSSSVIFTGSIDECDLPSIYRIASVFSLVSDRGNGRGEGIPLTPLEAMACGVPVIVGNQDGSKEAIFSDKNGYSIDPFDLNNHAKIIENLISDSELRNKLSIEARNVAQSYFSYQRFLEEHRDMYKNILRTSDGDS